MIATATDDRLGLGAGLGDPLVPVDIGIRPRAVGGQSGGHTSGGGGVRRFCVGIGAAVPPDRRRRLGLQQGRGLRRE